MRRLPFFPIPVPRRGPNARGGGEGWFSPASLSTCLLWGGEGLGRDVQECVACVFWGGELRGEGISAACSTDPSFPGPLPSPCSSPSQFFPFRSSGAGISTHGGCV